MLPVPRLVLTHVTMYCPGQVLYDVFDPLLCKANKGIWHPWNVAMRMVVRTTYVSKGQAGCKPGQQAVWSQAQQAPASGRGVLGVKSCVAMQGILGVPLGRSCKHMPALWEWDPVPCGARAGRGTGGGVRGGRGRPVGPGKVPGEVGQVAEVGEVGGGRCGVTLRLREAPAGRPLQHQ